MELEEASPSLLKAVRRRRSVIIALPGSDELRFLEHFGAEASVNATVDGRPNASIILRENPSKAAVLEEFLHGTQSKLGIIEKLGEEGAEAHVKRFMIRHRRLLRLGDADVNVIECLLAKGL